MSEPSSEAGPETAAPARPPATKTSLSPAWLWRIGLWAVLSIGLGSWGLYDALVAYPNRGERFASFAKFQYLSKADEVKTDLLGIFRAQRLTMENPREERQRLLAEKSDLQVQAQSADDARSLARAALDLAALEWLDALVRIGRLSPEHTAIQDPGAELAQLRERWTVETPPSPLSFYDIPSQWVITTVGYAVGAYVVVLFLRVATKTYRWDPASKRLTIPGGQSIVPEDLDDLDKRRWDKFLVFLSIRDGHDTLGGQELRIDLFRHAHLEGWILEMEGARFPDRVEEERAAAEQSEPPLSEEDVAGEADATTNAP
ncbi:MAG: hypothetical protein AAFR38_05815 [Planctomycetota bacterium]